MNEIEIKIEALRTLWGWATNLSENSEVGQLGDCLTDDVLHGRYTEEEAFRIQKQFIIEGNKLHKRLVILRKRL